MRVVMAPVEMLAVFSPQGEPRPIRFRIREADDRPVIRVGRVLCRQEERLAGNRMIVYQCQSAVQGVVRRYELKYEVATCQWFLSKL